MGIYRMRKSATLFVELRDGSATWFNQEPYVIEYCYVSACSYQSPIPKSRLSLHDTAKDISESDERIAPF